MGKGNRSLPWLLSTAFVLLILFAFACYGFFAVAWTDWKSLHWQIPNWELSEEETLIKKLESSNETKIILMWHKPGWLGDKPVIWFNKCGKCEFTFDKSMIKNTATGAVLFFYTGISKGGMPAESGRNQNQLHIFWTIEAPPNIRREPEALLQSNYQFNATMSYRRTSDFYTSYNYGGADKAIKSNLSASEILKMKTKGGLSLISNCGPTAAARTRLKILRKIQLLGFPLDGFGRCFPSNEPLKRENKGYIDRVRQYRFYFSFENSYHCRDYITEKVYENALFVTLAVPVVWGAKKEDYERVLPRGSFIYAEDFTTLEKLVEYLHYLMKNDTSYLEYFRWHKTEPLKPEGPIGGAGAGFCQICRTIHGIDIDDKHNPNYDPSNPPRPSFADGIVKRTTSSIHSFVFEEENEECNEVDARKWKFYNDWKLDESSSSCGCHTFIFCLLIQLLNASLHSFTVL